MSIKLPKKTIRKQADYWNKEYEKKEDFALSNNPAQDLERFFDWFDRQDDEFRPDKKSFILDIGCGNARNLIYVCQRYQAIGYGFDSSAKAIELGNKLAKERAVLKGQINLFKYDLDNIGLIDEKITVNERKMKIYQNLQISLPDSHKNFYFILDFMTSHYLVKKEERELYFATLKEMLDENGYLIIKSFLKDGDLNAGKILKKYGSTEIKNVYLHPKIQSEEYIWSEEDFFEQMNESGLIIEKFSRSHKHIIKGKIGKRRTFTAYVRKERPNDKSK